MESVRVPATEEDRQPWGDITESGWTYFGSILFTVILFALFHLKYERKVIRRPKNLKKEKNEKVLQTYLLAQEKAAHTVLPQGEQEVEQFLKQCSQRKKHPVIFKIEFSSAVEGAEAANAEVSSVACKPSNLAKNRSVDVVPFDSSRVILPTLGRAKEEGGGEKEREAEGRLNENNEGVDADGGYINASYVGGLLEGWDYIVTQGTMDTTLVDFWAMVWQEKVFIMALMTTTTRRSQSDIPVSRYPSTPGAGGGDADEDLRLHPCDVRPVLASLPAQRGGVPLSRR